jgi:hypothetical protein
MFVFGIKTIDDEITGGIKLTTHNDGFKKVENS